ncbi:hypothetical protein BCD64_07670 [Nostoc sp. MBR 210]|nr:hypothetical protein BCD64_07670 [Nostoc sp. MBR 210]
MQPSAERHFYETATPQEWIAAFQEWVESHRELNLPTLSDEDISRESIYGENSEITAVNPSTVVSTS